MQAFAQIFEAEDLDCAFRLFRMEIETAGAALSPPVGSLILTGLVPVVTTT
jgi:hypothetical protein